MQSGIRYRAEFLLATVMFALPAVASEGAFDTTFGSSGHTWIDVTASTTDIGDNLIRLPSGDFFMGGACNSVACAAWLTPTGNFASGYGTSGAGTALFSAFPGWPTDEDGITDAATFPDGRIAVTLSKSSGGYVAVLKADGSGLDAAVGSGAGYVSTAFNPALIRVTAQQQIIVVGTNQASPKAVVFARYDSTMHVDTMFGTGGATTVNIAGYDTLATGMTLQRDAKIVVAATVVPPGIAAFGLIRLTAGGTPDPDFGTGSDGRFVSFFGNNSYGVSSADVAVDAKGRLVIVGEAFTDGNIVGKWFINRLLGNGGTDASFNAGQPLQFTPGGSSQLYYPAVCCVALQGDGRIVVGGSANRTDNMNKFFAVVRLKDDGTGDTTFFGGDVAGGELSPQGNVVTDSPRAMVIVPGGIIVGGATTVSGGEVRFSAAKVSIDTLYANGFE